MPKAAEMLAEMPMLPDDAEDRLAVLRAIAGIFVAHLGAEAALTLAKLIELRVAEQQQAVRQ